MNDDTGDDTGDDTRDDTGDDGAVNDGAERSGPTAEPAEPSGDTEPGGRRTNILIAAAAVVVLAAISVGIYLVATSGDKDVAADPPQPTITDVEPSETPSSSPPAGEPPAPPSSRTKPAPPPATGNVAAARTTAEGAADAINARDIAAMKQLSCDPASVGSADAFPPGATARLTGSPQITGDKATAQIELSIAGSEPTVVPLPLEKRGGRWCVP